MSLQGLLRFVNNVDLDTLNTHTTLITLTFNILFNKVDASDMTHSQLFYTSCLLFYIMLLSIQFMFKVEFMFFPFSLKALYFIICICMISGYVLV